MRPTGKDMPFSIRLDPETQALIERMAKSRGRTRSWVVREAVARYAATKDDTRTLYERMKPFVGTVRSDRNTPLSEETGKGFADIVRTKARTRRAR
jgi:predicted DNA-binding protein